jgi:hypothetical protein
MTQQVLQTGGKQGVTEAAPQPMDDRSTAQCMHACFRLDCQCLSQRPRVPDLHARHRDRALCPARWACSNTPAARTGRIEQQAGRRPMFGIFRDHAAHEVADHRRQALVTEEGGIGANLQLAAHDGRIVKVLQRCVVKAEAEQQHTERIDIVGDAALASTCRQAHRGIGRFEQGRLPHGRRCSPGRAQRDWLTGAGLEDVIEADAPVGHASRLKLLEDQRHRP